MARGGETIHGATTKPMSGITWTEPNRRVREESPVVMPPAGTPEWRHGPHLPMHRGAVIRI